MVLEGRYSSEGGMVIWQGYDPGRGMVPGEYVVGGYAPKGYGHTPSPTQPGNRLTDTCENITFP